MDHHRTTETASGLSGQAAADDDVPEDDVIFPIWSISAMLVTVGLGIVAGPGGFMAGLGLSGLFFFHGIVVEAAAARNRK